LTGAIAIITNPGVHSLATGAIFLFWIALATV